MVVNRLYEDLQALPNRAAEQSLIDFRALPEAWDVCLGIVSGAHGPVPEVLLVFAAQTIYASARRTGLAAGDDAVGATIASRQQGLLAALSQPASCGGQRELLLCAALAALGVRNCQGLREALSSSLQQLPNGRGVKLLCAVAEEGEALLTRLGGDVEQHVALQHVLREGVGPHVLTWLATVATQLDQEHPQHQDQQQTPGHPQHFRQSQHPMELRVGIARCFAAWARLGCLYATCCPGAAVQVLVQQLLRGSHPSGDPEGALRHDACEALVDVIEYGPDILVQALHTPMVQLAAATAAAAAASPAHLHHSPAAWPTASYGVAASDADALLDVVQMVSSYAAARMGELVPVCCSIPDRNTGAAAPAAAAAWQLVEVMCRLAALPTVTESGYPVSWAALQVLADLALGCIAAGSSAQEAEAGPEQEQEASRVRRQGGEPRRGVLMAADGGGGDVAGDAMQLEDGGAAVGQLAPAQGNRATAPSADADAAHVPEHCVPDITLQPRPGLPTQLVTVYDNVLRAVLSCGVSWSLLTDPDADPAPVRMDEQAGACARDSRGGGGLLRLPPECGEVLATCLQACAGVVGQERQLTTAVALLQYARVPGCVGGLEPQQTPNCGSASLVAEAAPAAAAATAAAAAAAVPGHTAALTAALAAVAACSAVPVPVLPAKAVPVPPVSPAGATMEGGAGGGGDTTAMAALGGVQGLGPGLTDGGDPGGGVDGLAAHAAAAAAAVLLTAARHVRQCEAAAASSTATGVGSSDIGGGGTPRSLLVQLWLQYCRALAGSCRAVLQHVRMQAAAAAQQGPFCSQVGHPLWSWPWAPPRSGGGGALEGQMGGSGLALGCTSREAYGTATGIATAAATGALWELAEAALAGLQAPESAVAAARALRALVAATEALAQPLPVAMAERLVDAAHALPYDRGPRYSAAAREMAAAAVAAVRVAAGSSSAAEEVAVRLALLQRLLAPSLACIAKAAAAAAAVTSGSGSAPPPPQLPIGPAHHLPPAPPPPSSAWLILPHQTDAALSCHLRLLETTLATCQEAGTPSLPLPASYPATSAATAMPFRPAAAATAASAAETAVVVPTAEVEMGSSGPEAEAAGGTPEPAGGDWLRAVFVAQAWPSLRTLLLRGATGRFLLPLCRCLALLMCNPCSASAAAGAATTTTSAAAGAATTTTPEVMATVPSYGRMPYVCLPGGESGTLGLAAGSGRGQPYSDADADCGGGKEDAALTDPWVASVLETLPACVGRPGAKHVYEPLAALLKSCAGDGGRGDGGLVGPPAGWQDGGAELGRQEQRRRHRALAMSATHGVLYGSLAAGMAANWRSADQDPETAECLLRLATAAARYALAAEPPIRQYDVGGAAAAAEVAATAVAAAALRLAASSSGCDHRHVAAAALGCTCAVLEAACGPLPLAGPTETASDGGAGLFGNAGPSSGAAGACVRTDLVAVVMQLGPLVAAGLFSALVSSSPLPRLQKVATALLLLGGAVAHGYAMQHQPAGAGQNPSVALEACSRVISAWLAAAAAHLQLPQQDGADVCQTWAAMIAEAGACAVTVKVEQRAAHAAAAGAPSGPDSDHTGNGGVDSALLRLRGHHRRLRRLLREFAERRVRQAA